MGKSWVVLNAARAEPEVVKLAAALGARVEVTDDLAPAAVAALADGAERLIVGGGDGTVHAAARAILGAGAATALGIVPLGTANDFAAGLGLPDDPARALRLALTEPALPTDVGRLGATTFVNALSAGHGAAATRDADDDLKRILGSFAYAVSFVRQLLDLTAQPFRITTAEGVLERAMVAVCVCNTGRVGGVELAPQAEVDDGLLDLVAIFDVRLGAPQTLVAVVEELVSGTIDGRHVRRARSPWLTLEPLGGGCTANLDGEGHGLEGAVRIEAVPAALAVVRPAVRSR